MSGPRRETATRDSTDRHSRILQIGEAILLALVTFTAAWAGYSAARWGTETPTDIAQSSTLRNLATRDLITMNCAQTQTRLTPGFWDRQSEARSPMGVMEGARMRSRLAGERRTMGTGEGCRGGGGR